MANCFRISSSDSFPCSAKSSTFWACDKVAFHSSLLIFARTRVTENDLLFSITAEIGMLGLIPANFEEAYINQHVGLIRFHKEAQTKYFPYIRYTSSCTFGIIGQIYSLEFIHS